ncbi:MAG: sigma-E factor negative regulatory protein [Pseudomonadota bacterium]
MHKPTIEEAVSAMLDDALGQHETDLVIGRLRDDPAARAKIDRYALIGMAIRAETDGLPRRDMSADIMARIRAESGFAARSVTSGSKRPRLFVFPIRLDGLLQGWRAPAFGMALAATVAGVAVLLVQPAQHSLKPDFVALTPEPELAPEPQVMVAASDDDQMPDPYLVQHLTYGEGGAMGAMSSNVRLVAYERP